MSDPRKPEQQMEAQSARVGVTLEEIDIVILTHLHCNLKGAPDEHQPYLLGGLFTDMEAMWNSFEYIDEIVRNDFSRVIPGHDPLVYEKERYP